MEIGREAASRVASEEGGGVGGWAWRTCRASSTSFVSASQLPPRLLPTTETTSFWRPDFALFFLISFTLMSSRLLQVFLPSNPISLPVCFRENLIRVKRKWDSDTLYLVCVCVFFSFLIFGDGRFFVLLILFLMMLQASGWMLSTVLVAEKIKKKEKINVVLRFFNFRRRKNVLLLSLPFEGSYWMQSMVLVAEKI